MKQNGFWHHIQLYSWSLMTDPSGISIILIRFINIYYFYWISICPTNHGVEAKSIYRSKEDVNDFQLGSLQNSNIWIYLVKIYAFHCNIHFNSITIQCSKVLLKLRPESREIRENDMNSYIVYDTPIWTTTNPKNNCEKKCWFWSSRINSKTW